MTKISHPHVNPLLSNFPRQTESFCCLNELGIMNIVILTKRDKGLVEYLVQLAIKKLHSPYALIFGINRPIASRISSFGGNALIWQKQSPPLWPKIPRCNVHTPPLRRNPNTVRDSV